MTTGCRCDIGKMRKNNEDCCYINEEKGIFAVADGMGGHANGQIASALAIQIFQRETENLSQEEVSLEKLQAIITKINDEVYRYQEQEAAGKTMGTTLTAVILSWNVMRIVHIGDSRAYLYHDGVLMQLTEDHSYFAEMIRQGQLTENDIGDTKSRKNVLLKAIGPEPKVDAQYLSCKIAPKDKVLLCTDGLHNLLSDEEMAAILAGKDSAEQMANAMVELALARGGNDNITVIVYDHEQEVNW